MNTLRPEVIHPPARAPRGLGQLVAACIVDIVTATAVCRFIQSDAEHHFDEHLRRLELRWNLSEANWCRS